MAYPQNPTHSTKVASESEIPTHSTKVGGYEKIRYPNPPDAVNPDPATLREQSRFAIREVSRCHARAWGGVILAGMSFFALGWVVKGGNPLPSRCASKEVPK